MLNDATGFDKIYGGEHWDVQYPNGGYDNVYPDGKVRVGQSGRFGRGRFSRAVSYSSTNSKIVGVVLVGGGLILTGIAFAPLTGGVSLIWCFW